ncbi:membrane protein insertase YidC [Xanthobacteraceae bacterium Astr-EGSB]|uniref:membrane protein insertase YidC n=1 Tax=Astrobacterium formosum TaxID=3069710 RepID=UPI0027B5AAF0|nr:membrane protein insertase YidC [Xanthobacteraceae bacterium Astr-EGSB]
MTDQKNTILAIVLSALVLIGWQIFFGSPQMQKQQEAQRQAQSQQVPGQQVPGQPANPQSPSSTVPTPAQPSTTTAAPQLPGQAGITTAAQQVSREAALKQSPRVAIDTPRLKGSIALKGGRIDDVALSRFHETVDPTSPAIVLLSPSGSPHPFYAEFGWVGPANSGLKLPNAETLWRQQGTGSLTPERPLVLTFDNGEGLEFRRTIAVDERYLFTLKDEVVNKGPAPVVLHPYALISRHGTPATLGYYILHEGAVGYLGDKGLQEVTYKNLEDKKTITFDVTNAWFGITDKYWAATLLPDPKAKLQANFSATVAGQQHSYQTDYLRDAITIAPGATGSIDGRLFAGAKEVSVVDGYNKQLDVNHFDLLIDWGWFYFITKPLFTLMDWIFRLTGNFGIAILLVTVIIKAVFFPLANKSYASMAKMKAVQPQMVALRERYPDDKVKQQQELMELYKREKINPVAGCLPILVQIPVFFALYKVLFVTIEMRHAPFFGWIRDLSAPDPTNIFTLFGLIPYDPTVLPVVGQFLHMGVWPLIMGITMWVQMKLNPAPPDPTQKMIFDWMPIVFTFMLASFSAGLVIYWAWNNTLSVIQQSIIMKKHGAKIELFDNIRGMFGKKKPSS